MKPNLAVYSGMKICVAVSGGKDSMALLHYMYIHAQGYGIKLSALNCDHKIRGEASARDSLFVKEWCRERNIPLYPFVWNDYDTLKKSGSSIENCAREWRRNCYFEAQKTQTFADGTKWLGADAVATAHHMSDNAETVLFNLARGSGLSGMKGIADGRHFLSDDGESLNLIHPLIECTRAEIDAYIRENGIPYVEDESNLSNDYTRNYIRHNVLPELEKAVPGASGAIYRFSRLAAEDEEYFERIIHERGLVNSTKYGVKISFCNEKVLFKRAALKAFEVWKLKDYTSEHLQKLYDLQFAENSKKFEFSNIVAFKEDSEIVLCDKSALFAAEQGVPFCEYENKVYVYAGQYCRIIPERDLQKEIARVSNHSVQEIFPNKLKVLKFDIGAIPENALIRFMKDGDVFTKFGGGTKKLGDYFTDKKIPVRLRGKIPVIAVDRRIYAVCGVEISDEIKVTERTENTFCIISEDYLRG